MKTGKHNKNFKEDFYNLKGSKILPHSNIKSGRAKVYDFIIFLIVYIGIILVSMFFSSCSAPLTPTTNNRNCATYDQPPVQWEYVKKKYKWRRNRVKH